MRIAPPLVDECASRQVVRVADAIEGEDAAFSSGSLEPAGTGFFRLMSTGVSYAH